MNYGFRTSRSCELAVTNVKKNNFANKSTKFVFGNKFYLYLASSCNDKLFTFTIYGIEKNGSTIKKSYFAASSTVGKAVVEWKIMARNK